MTSQQGMRLFLGKQTSKYYETYASCGTLLASQMHLLHLDLQLARIMLLLLTLFMLITDSFSLKYYNHYKNVSVTSGIFIDTIDIQGEIFGSFYCIKICQENANCTMVTHETSNGSVCNLWTFTESNRFVVVHNEKSTLYAERNCKFLLESLFPLLF